MIKGKFISKMQEKNFLDKEKLETLTTVRLIAYKRKLQKFTPAEWEQDETWVEDFYRCLNDLREILNERGHIDRETGREILKDKNKKVKEKINAFKNRKM
jgi:hypothetical protein